MICHSKLLLAIALLISIYGSASCSNSKHNVKLAELSKGMPEIRLSCNSDSLNLIRANFNQDIYLVAEMNFLGKTYKNLRLRLRGDTSREFSKKSVKIKFPKGDSFVNGRNVLNMNADFLDPTSMRQFLASRLFAASGQPCFQIEPLALYINENYQGIVPATFT